MSKVLLCDVETTGLDHNTCNVIQFSAIYLVNNKEKDRIDIKMRPDDDAAIYKAALQVTHLSYKELISRKIGQYEGYLKLLKFLDSKVNKFNSDDKMYFVAYNAQFDENQVRAWFKRLDNNYFNSYFHWPSIDVAQILTWHTMNGRTRMNLENFKLMSVAKSLGIEIEESKLHDAMYDVEVMKQIYDKLIEERDT